MRTVAPYTAKVIDACAAPGNKTTQLAAMVGRTGEVRLARARTHPRVHAHIHACTHPRTHAPTTCHATQPRLMPRRAARPHAVPRSAALT